MKKFLLSLSFLISVLCANAQVVLNELYTEKSTYTGNNINIQYFELYNAGNNPVVLNCYTIISKYSVIIGNGSNQVIKTGYYVIDLPDVTLAPRGYYVGAAAGGPTTSTKSGGVTYTPNFSWNSGSAALASIGASFKNYEYDGTGYKASVDITPNTDFFTAQPTGDIKHNVFLFNSGIFVNGFVSYGSAGSPTVPSIFNDMPSLNITTSCGSYTIDWRNNVRESEYVGAATGNGHGYFRGKNGLCGTWDKLTLSNVAYATPTTENPLGTVTTTGSGVINSSQALICGTIPGMQNVQFTVTGINDPTKSVLPIKVELYYDNGTIGSLDNSDVLQSSSFIISSSDPLPYSGTFTIPTGQKVLIVYRSDLGCISGITVPSSTASLTTTQYNLCNQQAAFSITGASDFTLSYGFPVTVNFLYDGAPFGDPVTVSSLPSSLFYSNMFTDPTKLSIQYSPANCLSSSTVTNALTSSFISVTGSLTTNESLVRLTSESYPKQVSVAIDNIKTSINSYPSNVFPIRVWLYIDNTPGNNLPDTSISVDPDSNLGYVDFANSDLGNFRSFNGRQLTIADQGKNIYIVYKPALNCFGKTVMMELPSEIALPVTYTSFNAVRKNNTVALTWETASEENNRGFYIQRNTGGDWKDVAFVFSAAVNGNSNANLSYAYNDANASKGASQYRILQVDIDGKGRYSEIRSVRGLEQAAKVVVFPNPSTDKINVMFEDVQSVREVTVTDIAGRVVKQYRNVTANSLSIDNLKDGFYNIQVTDRHTGVITIEKAVMKKR